MSPELKLKIRESMFECLYSHGWKPGMDSLVMRLLPIMWIKLEKEGLTKDFHEGFRFFEFQTVAKRMLVVSQMGGFDVEIRYT